MITFTDVARGKELIAQNPEILDRLNYINMVFREGLKVLKTKVSIKWVLDAETRYDDPWMQSMSNSTKITVSEDAQGEFEFYCVITDNETGKVVKTFYHEDLCLLTSEEGIEMLADQIVKLLKVK